MAQTGESSSVLTAKWRKDWNHDGGVGWWVINPSRVLASDYLVIVHNDGPVDYDKIDKGPGPHNHITAVMRGLSIADSVRDSHSQEMRYLIGFTEFAVVPHPIPKPWASGKNPIRYFPTDQIPIDFDALDWQPFSELVPSEPQAEQPKSQDKSQYSTIELVQMLAQQLNQSPDIIMRKLLAP